MKGDIIFRIITLHKVYAVHITQHDANLQENMENTRRFNGRIIGEIGFLFDPSDILATCFVYIFIVRRTIKTKSKHVSFYNISTL